MDILLTAVTALSLLMAAAMALVVMKLLRDERRRSDARVAALMEMASTDVPAQADFPLKPEATPKVTGSFRLQPETRPVRSHAGPAARLDDLDLRPGTGEVAGVGDLFAEPERSSPWGRRLAVIASLAAVVATTGWVLFGSESRVASQQQAHLTPPAAAATTPPPLELLSLRHTQESGRLTITGLVQNPRGAAPLTRVVATAFAFGPDGTFLASARAPLDFTSLGGGDESPFVVTVPVTGTVARYRVGFRAEDGTVIAHVDKRSDPPSRANDSSGARARPRQSLSGDSGRQAEAGTLAQR